MMHLSTRRKHPSGRVGKAGRERLTLRPDVRENGMGTFAGKIINAHCHVGLLGDAWPQWGKLSRKFVQSSAFPIFALYARVPRAHVSDRVLREKAEELLSQTELDHVVCVALDYTRDEQGRPDPARTGMYVSNEYMLELRLAFGADHPMFTNFGRLLDELTR